MSSNLAAVQNIYQAFGSGNVPAILDALADDVEWEQNGTDHGVPWLKPGRGKAHVGAFFQSLAGLDLTRFELKNLLEGGNQVCAVIHASVTVKATGKSFDDEELHLWTFGDDGKVTAFHHLVDTHKQVEAQK